MAYDSDRGVTVLVGGRTATLEADTWEYDGRAWVEIETPVHPPARFAGAMSFDEARGVVRLFGGFGWADEWTYFAP